MALGDPFLEDVESVAEKQTRSLINYCFKVLLRYPGQETGDIIIPARGKEKASPDNSLGEQHTFSHKRSLGKAEGTV